MKSLPLFLTLLLPSLAFADSPPRFWKANFHGHTADDVVGDDGSEAPLELHRALARRGFAFSAHTPHSTHLDDAGARAAWARQRDAETALHVDGLTIAVGQELTVAPGRAFRSETLVLGYRAPGNLDHLTLLGADRYFPTGTPLATACRATHRAGGVCLVNHPGPGPMMWEPGLWEAPGNRELVDGIEVYNGQALAATGLDFAQRYLDATSATGLDLRVAAVTGCDTHGPAALDTSRARLRAYGRAARMLGSMAPSPDAGGREELDAATWVLAPSPSQDDVLAAVRARRTVATYRFDARDVEVDGLGEVRRGGDVRLGIRLGRRVAALTLYRNGVVVGSWTDVDGATFAETLARPAAYVWSVRDGDGRLLTSAIWYRP